METLVRDHMVEYMKQENLFSDRQYGFISGRSTSLQLLSVLDAWTEAIEAGYSIDAIYIWISAKHSIQCHIVDSSENYELTISVIH